MPVKFLVERKKSSHSLLAVPNETALASGN